MAEQTTTLFDVYTEGNLVTVTPSTVADANAYILFDALVQVTSKDEELIDQILHNANTNAVFTIPVDGHYEIRHFVIPTIKWFNEVYATSNLTYTGGIFYYDTVSSKFYKLTTTAIEVSIDDIISNINIDKSSVSYGIQHLFSILNLHQCYVSLAQQVLKSCPTECEVDSYSINSIRGKRDFVWAAINVIKYYVNFSLFERALLLLEKILKCNGLCGTITNTAYESDCGCH